MGSIRSTSVNARLSVVVALLLAWSLLAAVPSLPAEEGGFSDVSGGSHAPAINALAERGVFEGTECGDDLFCPGEPIQRRVMAVWLARILGESPSDFTGSRFVDVDSLAWWASSAEQLAEKAITGGCKTEPLSFCPDDPVKRGQMATFLVRAFELPAAPAQGFVDISGNVHEANINALYAAGVTAGCETEPLSFCPRQSVTRAQMATFLYRASPETQITTTDTTTQTAQPTTTTQPTATTETTQPDTTTPTTQPGQTTPTTQTSATTTTSTTQPGQTTSTTLPTTTTTTTTTSTTTTSTTQPTTTSTTTTSTTQPTTTTTTQPTTTTTTQPEIDAPDVKVTNVSSGSTVKFRSLVKGRVVLLWFWAEW